jgi:Leucine-rich repeat (LRR) protein
MNPADSTELGVKSCMRPNQESQTESCQEMRTALDLSFKNVKRSGGLDSKIPFASADELHLCGTWLSSALLSDITHMLDPAILHTLHLGCNPLLLRLPPPLSLLTSLSILGVGACRLEALPEWIHSLRMLEELHARDNCIPTLPPSIAVRTPHGPHARFDTGLWGWK